MEHSPRFLKLVNSIRPHVKELTVADVRKKQEQGQTFLLVDVREESEWAKGHLPQAMHLGKGIIERDFEKRVPDPNAEVVLYCGGGYRSVLAAENLQRMGYANVWSMDGGYRGWREAGLPIVSD